MGAKQARRRALERASSSSSDNLDCLRMSAPLRIRVVSHPPLPPLRAWLAIPSATATVSELAALAKKMLGGATEVELELQGEQARLAAGLHTLTVGMGRLHSLPRVTLRDAGSCEFCGLLLEELELTAGLSQANDILE